MNNQNILKFFGSRLDVKLDSSEYYDYELSKIGNDYNKEVLDFSGPIFYNSLKIVRLVLIIKWNLANGIVEDWAIWRFYCF